MALLPALLTRNCRIPQEPCLTIHPLSGRLCRRLLPPSMDPQHRMVSPVRSGVTNTLMFLSQVVSTVLADGLCHRARRI